MAKLSEDQRTTVVRLLKGGKHGRNEIARLAGVGQASVTRIAQQEGLRTSPAGADQSRQKQLAQAREDYNLQRRLDLINRLADQVEERLEAGHLSARDLQALAVTLGILTDKRRLDTGEATQRTEQVNAVFVFPSNQRGPSPDDIPLEPGEVRVLAPSNGRGEQAGGLPAGAVQMFRSWSGRMDYE